MVTTDQVIKYYNWALSDRSLMGRAISRVGMNKLSSATYEGNIAAVPYLAFILASSKDDALKKIARDTLSSLDGPELIDAFCDHVLTNDSRMLVDLAVARDYRPVDETRRALFYFITGQWDRYGALDTAEDRPLLRRGFIKAPGAVRKRTLDVARRSRKMGLLAEAVVGKNGYAGIDTIRNDEWGALIEGLKFEERWDDLWSLLFLAPPHWSAEIIGILKGSGLAPPEGLSDVWQCLSECGIKKWDPLISPDLLYKTLGGDHDIRHYAISPDGMTMASGCIDDLCLWGLRDGKLIKKFKIDTGAIECITFTSGGDMVAIGHGDSNEGDPRDAGGAVSFWNVHDGRLDRKFNIDGGKVKCIAFHPAGKIMALACHGFGDYPLHADDLLFCNIWDGAQIKRLQQRIGYVHCIVFSPNGKILATDRHCAVGDINTVCLWSVPDGALINEIQGYTHCMESLTFFSNRNMLAAGYDTGGYDVSRHDPVKFDHDHTLCLWNATDGGLIIKIDGEDGISATFSPDGKILAIKSHGRIVLYVLPWTKPLALAGPEDLDHAIWAGKDSSGTDDARARWKFVEVLLKYKLNEKCTRKSF